MSAWGGTMQAWGTASGTATLGSVFGTNYISTATTNATTGTNYAGSGYQTAYNPVTVSIIARPSRPRERLARGEALDLELPDGARLNVGADGAWRLDDSQQRVVYKSLDKREFNPCLNASDLLEDFIRYVGSIGIAADKIMGLPVELFIKWLVVEAMVRDQEDADEDRAALHRHLMIAAPTGRYFGTHCRACGRFVPERHVRVGLEYCSGGHADRMLARSQPMLALTPPRNRESA